MPSSRVYPVAMMKKTPHLRDPVSSHGGGAPTRLWRAILLRCPNCGEGPLFRRWVKMRESCPSCHLLLDRGEADYFLGSYTINFVVSELLIVMGAAVGIVLSWPDVPWRLLTWGLALMVVVAPILFYPFAKTLFLATDLIFRPLTEEDLDKDGP